MEAHPELAARPRRTALVLGILALLTTAVLAWPGPGPATATGPANSITTPDTGGTNDVGQFTSLALDASGNPVVSYYDNSSSDLKLLHCGNANCTAGNSITTPDTNDVGQFTSLALDASGNPVVSYLDSANGNLKVLHCDDPKCAGGGESITSPDTGGGGGFGSYTSLALDSSGNPVVSYRGGAYLKVLHCNDPNCTGVDESITSPDIGVFLDTSLQLDASGNPVVSYWDGINFALKVLHCNDLNCDPAVGPGPGPDPDSITSPDTPDGHFEVLPDGTATSVGRYTSLALDASGNPVVSYHGHKEGLKVLHCGNANCTAGNSITTPDTNDVGQFTSLALDASGNPVVSYVDSANGNLKVLHCDDPKCAGGGESITTPDTGGGGGFGFGSYTSLALDATGNPVVSYQGAGELKLLHCGNPNCKTWLAPTPTPTPTRTPTPTITPTPTPKDPNADTDGDTVPNGIDPDDDNDGCPDVEENGPDERDGGRRNPHNPWDYFNPTNDGTNRSDDILAVVLQYRIDQGDPGYDAKYDRTHLGPNDWNLGPPNGTVRSEDILHIVHQYRHDCGTGIVKPTPTPTLTPTPTITPTP